MIEIARIGHPDQVHIAHKIRFEVFVEEQQVPKEEELDEFEDQSTHYLAYLDQKPAGTARWRFTRDGIKLERFAVLKAFRNKGVGSALMEYILKEISEHNDAGDKDLYLHAQLKAMSLYSKFGFVKTGGMFSEAGILHYKMIKKRS